MVITLHTWHSRAAFAFSNKPGDAAADEDDAAVGLAPTLVMGALATATATTATAVSPLQLRHEPIVSLKQWKAPLSVSVTSTVRWCGGRTHGIAHNSSENRILREFQVVDRRHYGEPRGVRSLAYVFLLGGLARGFVLRRGHPVFQLERETSQLHTQQCGGSSRKNVSGDNLLAVGGHDLPRGEHAPSSQASLALVLDSASLFVLPYASDV